MCTALASGLGGTGKSRSCGLRVGSSLQPSRQTLVAPGLPGDQDKPGGPRVCLEVTLVPTGAPAVSEIWLGPLKPYLGGFPDKIQDMPLSPAPAPPAPPPPRIQPAYVAPAVDLSSLSDSAVAYVGCLPSLGPYTHVTSISSSWKCRVLWVKLMFLLTHCSVGPLPPVSQKRPCVSLISSVRPVSFQIL